MKNKTVSEYPNEELISYEKKIKINTIMLGVAILLLFLSNIFLTFKRGFSVMSAIPIDLVQSSF